MTRTKILRFSLQRLMVICFAASSFQVHANHVVDFALEPPLLTVVQAGHSAVLDCGIQAAANYSLDAIHIQWLDGDGQPISFLGDTYRSQLLNNSLYVSSVLADAGLTGQYQCKATLPNGAGSIVSRRARLELAWLADFDEEPTEELLVFAGEKVHFPCRITGQPSPVRVRWLKDERPLAIDELRMTILPSGGLEIDEIGETDQGTYRCNASSMNLHKLSGRATLTLNGDAAAAGAPKPPTFIVRPQSRVTATEAQTVTLDCAANGNPRPKVKWLKDGANIDMADLDSRFSKVGTTSSLKISNIKEEDAGSYQCLAENREDSIDASATVQVQVPPRFKRRPSDKVEYVSKEVELECVVYGRPEPQVQWLKNGELIHPNGYHQIVNGNNLKIMGLLLTDTGLFQCIATNAAGNIQGSASLKVFNQDPQRTNKKPHNRKKFHHNRQVDSSKSPLPSPTPGSSSAADDEPFQQSSQALFASLQPANSPTHAHAPPPRPHPPNSFQILTSLSSSSSASAPQLGSTLNAYSHAQAPPNQRRRPSAASGEESQQQQQFDESMFDADADVDDADDVDDDLHSEGGSSWFGDGEGGGGGRPGPPLDVAALVTKARFVVLSWRAPAVNADDVTTYSVFYRQDGNARERVQNTSAVGAVAASRRPASARAHLEEAHLSDLQPASVYVVRVAAWNHLGMGRSSLPLSVATAFEENNVPGPPRQVRAHATSSRSAHVQWLEPDAAQGATSAAGGDLRYRVSYMEHGGERHTVETQDTQVDLSGLSPYTVYTVSIEALNAQGLSAPTGDVAVRTFSAAPAEAPQNVTFEVGAGVGGVAALVVRWEPPPAHAQNGAVTGYKIRYRVKGNKADTVTVEGGKREWALRGVERGAAYQVRLWAMNVNGTGPPTDWLDVDTHESDLDEGRVPDAPGDLRAKATSNTITLFWTPPLGGAVRVRNYLIGWGKGVPDMFSVEVGEREREFTVAPLESQSEYVVSLRASNEMGAGVPKYATIRTVVDAGDHPGGDDAPAAPLLPPIGVKAEVLGDTSAVMYWTDTNAAKAPSYGASAAEGRYYVVHYQAEGLKAKEVNVSTNNILLGELRPGTMYEFSVRLVKGRRESPWSMVVANATSGAPPPAAASAAPRELQVRLLQDGAQLVRLSWLPPKPSGASINGYVILYTSDASRRDRDWNATAVKGDRLTCDMAHLDPDTRYYFKVHARVNKGNGPFSATATIETGPNIGTPPPVNKAGVFSGTTLLYLIGGALALVVATVLLAVFCLCCRGRAAHGTHLTQLGATGASPDRSKKGYQGVSGGAGGGGHMMGGSKPPDLWIHHDQMELKQMDCGKGGGDGASSSGALTLPRGSIGGGDDYDPRGLHHHHHHHHLNSLDKRTYAPTYMDDGNNTMRRHAAAADASSPMTVTAVTPKAKPLTLMHAVMQQHQQLSPRDPVATSACGNNASLNTSISSTTPLSHHERDLSLATSTPMRPSMSMAGAQALRPAQYLDQGAMPPPPHLYNNTGANVPTTYDPYSNGSGYGTTAVGGGVQHPLKSFTVPAPPPVSAPGTPKHVVSLSAAPLPVSYYQVRPQPPAAPPSQASPYKRPCVVAVAAPCVGGGGSGASTPPQLHVRAAGGALPPHSADEVQRLTPAPPGGGVRPSHSTEELNQEMEHLKGLMITLNKITASEFEC